MERPTRPVQWIRLFAALALALALALGCDSSSTSPVAPSGNVLAVSANPSTIGLEGSASLVATLRLSNGVPGREGTEVSFSTNLGRIVPALGTTDADGIVRATFTPDGRTGSAQIRAASGSLSAQTNVSVQSGPSANFSTRSNGLQVIFTDSSSGNPTSWSWNFGDGGTSGQQSPVHTYASPGTYTVTLTVSNSDGSGTKRDFVTVPSSAGPSASFTSSTNGLTAIFTDRSTGNPETWRWRFGDGVTSGQQNPSHTYNQDGTYTVELTVTNVNGDSTVSNFVTVSVAGPTASFTSQADGLTVIFTDRSTGDPSSWEWDFGDGEESFARSPIHTYAAAGTYTVTLTVANAGGRSSASNFVSVSTTGPTASFTSQADGLTVIFTDRSTGNPTAWDWDFGDGTGSGEQSPIHTYAAEGTYTVTLTVANASGSGTTSSFVTVSAGPGPTASFTSTTDGLTVIFTDRSTGNPTAWAWDFGDGETSSETSPIHTYAAAGTYTVTLTVSNASGSDSTSSFVTVSSGPGPSASFTSTTDGLTVIFTDRSTGDPTAWAWDFGDGEASSEASPIHTYAAAGTYTVTLTVSNASGSDTTSSFVSVSAGPEPTASFTSQANGLTVIFTDRSTGNPTSWAWDFGDGVTSSEQSPTHTYAAADTYTVALTVTNDSGSDTTSSFVTVSATPGPTASFTSQANGLTVIFTDRSTGNPTSWAWDFGDGGISSEQSPTHTYPRADTFTVTLTVSNDAGSSSTSSFVTVSDTTGPSASFSSQTNALTVIFSDNSSGNPTSWSWDFGDGTASSAQNPTHTYAAEGTYTVTLTVANAEGSDSTSSFVTVSLPSPPSANFSFQANGLTVIFTDLSSGNPTRWIWDFGDGALSDIPSPTHTYAAAGTYTVTLTVFDDFDQSSSKTLFVTLF